MDFVTLGVIAIVFSNHAQKCGQICCKSVQLVRVSSFRNDLLQNTYFRLRSGCGGHHSTTGLSPGARRCILHHLIVVSRLRSENLI